MWLLIMGVSFSCLLPLYMVLCSGRVYSQNL